LKEGFLVLLPDPSVERKGEGENFPDIAELRTMKEGKKRKEKKRKQKENKRK
jgi:hypothetical protein